MNPKGNRSKRKSKQIERRLLRKTKQAEIDGTIPRREVDSRYGRR